MARPAPAKASPPRELRNSGDRKPRAERWEELREAAAEIFYEKGYDAASLQEIADRVGILKGSVYYYIKTKADLRNHLLVEVHHGGIAMIRKCAQVKGSALEKLEAMIRGHVNYVCRNLPKTTLYLQELKKLTRPERVALFGPTSYRDVFHEVIQQGQEEGLILPNLDLKLTSQAMLGSLNSIYEWYQPARLRPSGAIADHFVATILRGHATDAGLAKLGVSGGAVAKPRAKRSAAGARQRQTG